MKATYGDDGDGGFALGGGGLVLLTEVDNPQEYGMAELRGDAHVRLVERPDDPVWNLAVIGLYFYVAQAFDIIRGFQPSRRRELEIADVNNACLWRAQLQWRILERLVGRCRGVSGGFAQGCFPGGGRRARSRTTFGRGGALWAE